MILGIGSDLCEIKRIAQSMERFGERFLTRIFTPVEIEAGAAKPAGMQPAFFAKRFAAKEACAKALGTGIAKGVYLTDIGVSNTEDGAPVLVLTGGAAARLDALCPPRAQAVAHLSLSDDAGLAQAFVVLSVQGCGKPA